MPRLWKRLFLMSLLLAGLLLWPGAPVSASLYNEETSTAAQGCPAVDALLADPAWRAHLADPVFASSADQRERLIRYGEAYACRQPRQDGLAGEQAELFELLEWARIFLVSDPARLAVVDPASSDDPALVRLREAVGLPPPPGQFYVRFYTAYAEMPAPVRAAFEDEDVAGVTFYTRYIAVLVQDPLRWNAGRGLDEATGDILSHELVHAYVASTLGYPEAFELPVWYREGLAIYLSGSNRNVTYWSPAGSITHVPTAQYREYGQNFAFLEARLGRAGLERQIRASIEARDPGALYRGLGLESENAFHLAVDGWVKAGQRRRTLAALAGLLAAAGLTFLTVAWWTGRQERRDIEAGDYLPPPGPGNF